MATSEEEGFSIYKEFFWGMAASGVFVVLSSIAITTFTRYRTLEIVGYPFVFIGAGGIVLGALGLVIGRILGIGSD